MQKTSTINTFLSNTHYHPSWDRALTQALKQMDEDYLQSLLKQDQWLPGIANVFNAFSLPLEQVNYLLMGESPYPRSQSANGYAFWDQAVEQLWSANGLSKEVNRATSLRNFIKMLLVGNKKLSPSDTSQPAIAKVNKSGLITTNAELFSNLINHGFLLLNASPVLSDLAVRKEAKYWQPFMAHLLEQLGESRPELTLILFGKIAEFFDKLNILSTHKKLCSEHPYNISFILNQEVIDFFTPFALLHNK